MKHCLCVNAKDKDSNRHVCIWASGPFHTSTVREVKMQGFYDRGVSNNTWLPGIQMASPESSHSLTPHFSLGFTAVYLHVFTWQYRVYWNIQVTVYCCTFLSVHTSPSLSFKALCILYLLCDNASICVLMFLPLCMQHGSIRQVKRNSHPSKCVAVQR